MDKIIKRLAGKLGIDEDIIEKAIRSEFRFVAETMQEGEHQSVHLHHFAKFAVKPNAVARLERMKRKPKEDYGSLEEGTKEKS